MHSALASLMTNATPLPPRNALTATGWRVRARARAGRQGLRLPQGGCDRRHCGRPAQGHLWCEGEGGCGESLLCCARCVAMRAVGCAAATHPALCVEHPRHCQHHCVMIFCVFLPHPLPHTRARAHTHTHIHTHAHTLTYTHTPTLCTHRPVPEHPGQAHGRRVARVCALLLQHRRRRGPHLPVLLGQLSAGVCGATRRAKRRDSSKTQGATGPLLILRRCVARIACGGVGGAARVAGGAAARWRMRCLLAWHVQAARASLVRRSCAAAGQQQSADCLFCLLGHLFMSC
jgi:hypothetical protein